MEQEIHITLRYHLAIGRVTLNEIVYQLQQLRDPPMLEILKQILRSYDDLISERLSTVKSNTPSKAREGPGQHVRKCDPKDRFCHGLRIRKRGHRNHPRCFTTVFGKFKLPLRVAECCTCGARYCPLLSALKLKRLSKTESMPPKLPISLLSMMGNQAWIIFYPRSPIRSAAHDVSPEVFTMPCGKTGCVKKTASLKLTR